MMKTSDTSARSCAIPSRHSNIQSHVSRLGQAGSFASRDLGGPKDPHSHRGTSVGRAGLRQPDSRCAVLDARARRPSCDYPPLLLLRGGTNAGAAGATRTGAGTTTTPSTVDPCVTSGIDPSHHDMSPALTAVMPERNVVGPSHHTSVQKPGPCDVVSHTLLVPRGPALPVARLLLCSLTPIPPPSFSSRFQSAATFCPQIPVP